MSIVTIVGAGMMGSAMSFPLADNGHEIRLVGTPYDRKVIDRLRQDHFHPALKVTLPEAVKPCQIEELGTALQGTELLISGVPSFGIDWFAGQVLSQTPDSVPVLSLTKGLEDEPDGTLLPISKAYFKRPALASRHLSISSIGGPCISYELCARRHTTVALCGDDLGQLEQLRTILQTPYYHIRTTTDSMGIECAVAMKNAYAVGVSLAIGISEAHKNEDDTHWYNPQAALFGQAMSEMMRLIKLLGGQPQSVIYAASDLYVTIIGGRNRQLGLLLGEGLSFAEAQQRLAGVTLESISIITRAARALRLRRDASINDFPLLRHLDEIINRQAKLNIPWTEF
ncbi:MAG: hypothetical protein J6866_02345 [Victivallales bacterium]|nr:hypothetical protein [Victivallales bacterium]